MGICEAGHRSASDDYCDTCGSVVHPDPAAAAPARPAPAGPATQHCPNCRAVNPADALFCEACGYDYTTGALPRQNLHAELGLTGPQTAAAPTAAPSPSEQASTPGPATAPAGGDVSGVSAPQAATSAERGEPSAPDGAPVGSPAGATSEVGPGPAAQEEPSQSGQVADATPAATDTSQLPPPDGADASPLDDVDEPTRGRPAPRRELWVAEVWVDPDWYAVQDSPDAMPSVGLPATVRLTDTNLIGRPSASRGIVPAIDCGADTGCSRKQAELSTDGSRWFVEDLGSANGTFLAKAAGPLPTEPLTARTEVGTDDRIYVGAWTRIVVRKASREEYDAL